MNIPHHGKYEWLPILYKFVASVEPKTIVEFGPGRGFTTVTMAKALSECNINGHIKSYDMWIVDNTGEKLEMLYNGVKDQIKNGSVVFFEGGSKERDLHGVAGKNMYDIKDKIGYEVLTENVKYSASTIYNSKIYNMDFE